MARKKPGVSSNANSSRGKAPINDLAELSRGRVKPIQSMNDVPQDDEDAFFAQQDRILLDEPRFSVSNGRGTRAADTLDQDEEVYGLDLSEEGDEDDDDVDDEDDEQVEELPSRPRLGKPGAKDHQPLPGAKTSRYDRPDQVGRDDIMYDAAANASESSSSQSEEDDDDERWKSYHVGRKEAEEADSEDEETAELELAESIRLQRLKRQSLSLADYGLNDSTQAEWAKELTVAPLPLTEVSLAKSSMSFTNRDEAIAHLQKTSPELLALVDDYAEQLSRLEKTQQAVSANSAKHTSEPTHEGTRQELQANRQTQILHLYHQILLTYLSVATFYLHLRATHSPDQQRDLQEAVFIRLAELRQVLADMTDLDLGIDDSDDEKGHTSASDESDPLTDEDMMLLRNGSDGPDEPVTLNDLANLNQGDLRTLIGDLDDAEIEALIAEQKAQLATSPAVASPQKKKRKSDGAAGVPNPEKAKKAKMVPEESYFSAPLLQLEPLPLHARDIPSADRTDDFVDPLSMSATDSADKESKKRSLKFYTAKIDAKSKRAEAGQTSRPGGDEDVPYRSKERARQAVLQRQQHLRDSRAQRADLDGADFDANDLEAAGAINAVDADAEGYYDLVTSKKAKAKQDKQEAHDLTRLVERDALTNPESIDPNNPRSVSRAIMANKGLTPKRPKEARNPRVKKRLRYEKAQKKLASMKPTYKGGLSSLSGDYSGEKSGISANVTKSVRLSK
ncbi:uncharacterized protein L969DRAFT_94195 [Mixia osmundae IAM 14324]|uniref:Sas10 C-terminal domain-containing protein n=1 Tax=Mixia osmundae (strain CBS 9802 / IAM 14324 / JCM 22182 / KY 12970) TaxID=764103 RepID=G7E6I4_MIXOS|nr:uncharacterized protein L969DRAFT_94195 [Mixia osmundae IAM 14324]KEI40399.1 hypothetical protein L969DRAFT_94195 [Mixia osmundae IAM 14324]GAA98444.1 hypothetical protein E5Q_05130 [Mixia osmundae IAM 14324]